MKFDSPAVAEQATIALGDDTDADMAGQIVEQVAGAFGHECAMAVSFNMVLLCLGKIPLKGRAQNMAEAISLLVKDWASSVEREAASGTANGDN